MKALILLIVSGILAAGVFITGKQAGSEQLSPLLILFWQMTGGALVVWIAAMPARLFPRWDMEHLRYYLFGGFLGVSLPYVLAFIVLQQLQVGIVGLLTALSPIMTYAMARLLKLEAGHPLRLLGLMFGLAGVAMLVMPGNSLALSADWPSMLMALGIPLSLAASNIYRSRYWPTGSTAVPLVVGMLTVQSAGLLLVNLLSGNFYSDPSSIEDTGLVLMVLAIMAGASYLSSFNLLKVGGPVYLSQMGYVITAATMLAGVLLWDEHYDTSDLLSMGMILTGVLLTTVTQMIQQAKKSPAIAHQQ
jgi:drug/metabolite transporter (DMT)-like permease